MQHHASAALCSGGGAADRGAFLAAIRALRPEAAPQAGSRERFRRATAVEASHASRACRCLPEASHQDQAVARMGGLS